MMTLTPAKAATIKKRLTATARRRLDVLAKGEEITSALYSAMLDAADAGLTYNEIAEAVGLSRIRVAQVLREERERVGA